MSEFRDPMRFPRVFNNIQKQKYNRVGAICQLQSQRLVKNYEDRFVYFINEKQKFLGITESSIVFLIQNAEKTSPSNEYKVDKLRLISDVKKVCSLENFLILKFIDESRYEIADIVKKIIVSRSYYCNLSNMTKIASKNLLQMKVYCLRLNSKQSLLRMDFIALKLQMINMYQTKINQSL